MSGPDGRSHSVGSAVVVTLATGDEERWVDEGGWELSSYSDDDSRWEYAYDYSYEIDGSALRIYSSRWGGYRMNGWPTWQQDGGGGEVAYYPEGQWRRVRMGLEAI